jgi:salicylate hydroxylase
MNIRMGHAPHVLMAGGGIAGLATAIGLGQKGHQVVVLERSAFSDEVGAGIQLGPNASAALRSIGAYDAVATCTSSPPEVHIRDGRSGKLLQRLSLGPAFEAEFGAPYLVAHRADLHAALLGVARAQANVVLEINARVSAVDVHDKAVIAQTERGTFSGSHLVAADGVRSTIRRLVFGAGEPVALPFSIFRALPIMPSQSHGLALDCVNLWLCPGGHVVHYPAGQRQRLNLVVVTDGLTKDLKLRFRHVCGALAEILTLADSAMQWPALVAPPLPSWHRGRVCLVGDAAHATVPFLAQGAAMALEDAAVLCQTFDFAAFDAARRARLARLDRQSRQMARIYHARGIQAWARDAAMQMELVPAWKTVSWIYKHSGVS